MQRYIGKNNMLLSVSIDDRLYDISVLNEMIVDAEDLYIKMDKDMDKGWQISRYWTEQPNPQQRCQIVADKIADAIHDENEKMTLLMSGYILSRMPQIKKITIDTSGDITQTEFFL